MNDSGRFARNVLREVARDQPSVRIIAAACAATDHELDCFAVEKSSTEAARAETSNTEIMIGSKNTPSVSPYDHLLVIWLSSLEASLSARLYETSRIRYFSAKARRTPSSDKYYFSFFAAFDVFAGNFRSLALQFKKFCGLAL